MIPSQFPTQSSSARIAIIGDTITKRDLARRKHLSGPEGMLLWSSLKKVGIEQAQCFVSSVNRSRPLPGDVVAKSLQGKTLRNALRNGVWMSRAGYVVLIQEEVSFSRHLAH